MLLGHGVSLCFVLLPALRTLWITFQAKNNVGNISASSALPKSHTEAILCLLQTVAYTALEKGIVHKGEQR